MTECFSENEPFVAVHQSFHHKVHLVLMFTCVIALMYDLINRHDTSGQLIWRSSQPLPPHSQTAAGPSVRA